MNKDNPLVWQGDSNQLCPVPTVVQGMQREPDGRPQSEPSGIEHYN